MIGYLVGGAFLSLAYFDLPYNILAIAILTKQWFLKHRLDESVELKPANSGPLNTYLPSRGKSSIFQQ